MLLVRSPSDFRYNLRSRRKMFWHALRYEEIP